MQVMVKNADKVNKLYDEKLDGKDESTISSFITKYSINHSRLPFRLLNDGILIKYERVVEEGKKALKWPKRLMHSDVIPIY